MSLHVMYRAHEALDTMLELVSPHQMFIYLFIYLFICYLLIYLLTQVYFLRACKIRRECESGFAFPHGHPVAFGFFQISHSPYSHSIHSFIHSYFCLWSRQIQDKIDNIWTVDWKWLLGLHLQFLLCGRGPLVSVFIDHLLVDHLL